MMAWCDVTGPFRKSTTNNDVSVDWYRRMDQVPERPDALTLIGQARLAACLLSCLHAACLLVA